MARIGSKVADRIGSGLKRFQPILESARVRDINESDTVVIITDILQDVFGFDKYSEITSEHSIRGTFCDLAIKLQGRLSLLIEVKAIGLDLKENHIRQAVDYAANQGCEWVVLTNAIIWRAFRVSFEKPIRHELVLDLNLTELAPKKASDIELLWLISRDGLQKAGLAEYQSQREALSRFTLAALILTDPVLELLRRELRRVSPDARIDVEQISPVLVNEVLKREVVEGERAQSAKRTVARSAGRPLRKTAEEDARPAPTGIEVAQGAD